MRIFHFILFLSIVSCDRAKESVTKSERIDLNETSLISFQLENSLRIPNHKVSIEISKRYNGIFLHATSNPFAEQKKWEYTNVDTTFLLDSTLFNKILISIRKISSRDLESSFRMGDDGTSCEIKYGNEQNSISYLIWSPGSDAKARKTENFLKACIQIIEAAKLDPEKIL